MIYSATIKFFVSLLILICFPLAVEADDSYDLSKYRWKNRLILLFAPRSQDSSVKILKEKMEAYKDEILDRDLVLFYIFENGSGQVADSFMDEKRVASLIKRFAPRPGLTTCILIGKDGREKYRKENDIDFQEIFSLIDSMPMRQQEIEESHTIDRQRFRLYKDQSEFTVREGSGDSARFYIIPKSWLIFPDEEREDREYYVSSFNYDETIHSFNICESLIGLHISSYNIQKEGSAQAALGRDIFLVYDKSKGKFHPGLTHLGITKERIRTQGNLLAKHINFVISDINRDGFRDIGVICEELNCRNVPPSLRQEEIRENVGYQRYPIQWHIFNKNQWDYQAQLNGENHITNFINLPLINLVKSAVDFVREICFHEQTLLLDYSYFGPQAMAYNLIGYQWYQWDNHGYPDPRKRYDIKVIVYKGIYLSKLMQLFPVDKVLLKDYRYLNYQKALNYLENQILILNNSQKESPESADSELFEQMIERFQKTKSEISNRFNK